jgi:transposase
VISGLAVSPKGRRLSLYFRFHHENITSADAADFLRHLLRHLPGPVIVIWDNAQIHKGQAVRELCRNPRLHLEALPPYAPELNPDEGVWAHAKRALANGRPDDEWELLDELLAILYGVARSQRHLRGFIRQSDLPPFLP